MSRFTASVGPLEIRSGPKQASSCGCHVRNVRARRRYFWYGAVDVGRDDLECLSGAGGSVGAGQRPGEGLSSVPGDGDFAVGVTGAEGDVELVDVMGLEPVTPTPQ